MHLGHVCMPGAAGIARAMPGEVVKSAPTLGFPALTGTGCRECNVGNLNKLVNLKADPSLNISEKTMRLACVARYQRSREGRRHASGDDAAQVGSHKISSKSDAWNIDMHASHTMVALFEMAHAELLQSGTNSANIKWDDHSKIEADKKRGYTSRAVVTHRSQRKTAPYSDMGSTVALGGAKAVINSILVTSLPATDPNSSTTSKSTRLQGLLVHKQAFAVCRLDHDRRSTPVQQFNDLRFVAAQQPYLEELL